MADSPKKKKPAPKVLNYPTEKVEGMTKEKAMTKVALDPAAKAMALTRSFVTGVDEGSLHPTELLTELMIIGNKARNGDLGGIEAMLAAQAYSLDALFCNLALRAKSNMGQYPKTAEIYMKMALRAQSQCRATAETLAVMKNPQPYIKQTNIGAAVQVNNAAGGKQKSGGLQGKPATHITDNANPNFLKHSDPEVLDSLCAPAQEISSPQTNYKARSV